MAGKDFLCFKFHIHIIDQIFKKLYRLWCLACDKMAEPDCHEEMHKVTNFVKHVHKFDSLLIQLMLANVQQNIENVTRGFAHVQTKFKQLKKQKKELDNRSMAVEEKLREVESCQQKLNQLMAECEEMKILPDETKAMASMRQNVEKKIADLKQEGEKLQELVQSISLIQEEMKEKVEASLTFLVTTIQLV